MTMWRAKHSNKANKKLTSRWSASRKQ